MRDYITTASLGVVSKLYDDLVDNSIIGDGIIKESLFTLLCFLLSAVSYNDFSFSLIVYFLNFFSFIGSPEQFENNKEKSLIYAFPILILFSISSLNSVSFLEVILLILTTILAFFESFLIKEDVSVRKLIIRSLGTFLSIVVIIGGPFFSISKSTIKLFLFGIGYLLTSVFFQIYSLYFKNTDLYQKWFAPVNSAAMVTDQPDETEISSKNTEKEKVLDSQQKQV
jgi:hypothetical protein